MCLFLFGEHIGARKITVKGPVRARLQVSKKKKEKSRKTKRSDSAVVPVLRTRRDSGVVSTNTSFGGQPATTDRFAMTAGNE